MNGINSKILHEEATRLLKVEESILDIIKNKQATTSIHDEKANLISNIYLEEFINTIQEEQTKLKESEIIIAVVGPMKAGKSTTINAIVGIEVLPSRDRPMTTIPTLIRHTPGQKKPILKLENNTPLNELIVRINKKINKKNEKMIHLNRDPDMKKTMDFIKNDHGFGVQYEGSDDIFIFLTIINDLVRLSKQLEIDFPFAEYSKLNALPVIEVEFVHLHKTNKNSGRLTLLDTPGPNQGGIALC